MSLFASPFQNMGRDDDMDTTQNNLDNTRYANYLFSNFSSHVASTEHITFATSQPSVTFTALTNGTGLSGDSVDADSALNIKTTQARALEKLQLFQRPFVTVPYMGRGFSNPGLESQLLQGETTNQMKSVGTVMEQSFLPYSVHPVDAHMQDRVQDTKYTVEEAALEGWVRGGSTTRE